jgi:hypothetical protein
MVGGHRFLIARKLSIGPLHSAVVRRPPAEIKQRNDIAFRHQLLGSFVPEGSAIVGLENQARAVLFKQPSIGGLHGPRIGFFHREPGQLAPAGQVFDRQDNVPRSVRVAP